VNRSSRTGVDVNPEELIKLRLQAGKLVLPGQYRSSAAQSGQRHSTFRGRGMDYQESRGYQPGDDIRMMDWRVTARTGKAHTKIYQEERERPVLLLVDCNPSMDFGSRVSLKKVVAAQLAALLAWAAIRHGDRVGAFLFGAFGHHELPPRGGRSSVLHLIRELTRWNDPSNTANASDTHCTLATVAQSLRRVIRPGSLVFIISDFYNLSEDAERHLLFIRRHNDIVACQILDPLEQTPPPPGLYGISDGKNLRFFNSRSATARQHYEQFFASCQARLLRLTEHCAIPLLSFSTDGDLLQSLQHGLAQPRPKAYSAA